MSAVLDICTAIVVAMLADWLLIVCLDHRQRWQMAGRPVPLKPSTQRSHCEVM